MLYNCTPPAFLCQGHYYILFGIVCRTTIHIGHLLQKVIEGSLLLGYYRISKKTNRKEHPSMINSITQNMRYRQSLISYSQKYGVSRAARKYNKSRSYIYFWLKRYDGTTESLKERSRRPHHHPNEHTHAEKNLILLYVKRNPKIGIVYLWCKLRDV